MVVLTQEVTVERNAKIIITIEVVSDGDSSVTVGRETPTAVVAEPASAASTSPAIAHAEDRIKAFMSWNADGLAECAYQHMLERGWHVLPTKTKDLRLKYTGKGRSAVLYINSNALVSDSVRQMAKLSTIDGAKSTSKERVAFYYADLGQEGIKQAIDQVTDWVDAGKPAS
jgi:hypothetical protein